MKIIYKLISILLCLIMSFSVCACNFLSGDDSGSETSSIQEQIPDSSGEYGGTDDVIQAVATTISYAPED